MKAGFARERITPPLGTPMMGFGTRDHAHGCTGIHDDVYARALFLEDEGNQALILGFDLCFLGRADVDRLKRALGNTLGLSPAQILLNTSHNHCGPAVGTWYDARPSPSYLDLLDSAVLRVAASAHEAAHEVTILAGTTRSALPLSRRRRGPDGTVRFAPNPEGEVCDALPFCLFQEPTGTAVCLLFSVSCHPSMMSGWEITAEYPGAAMDRLDSYFGHPVSLFLQGTGGDAKPSITGKGRDAWRPATWEDVAEAGTLVANEVITALEAGPTGYKPRLRAHLVEAHWPLQPLMSREEYVTVAEDGTLPEVKRRWARRIVERLDRGEPLPHSVPIRIHGMQIAEGVRLIGLEGEAVAGLGRHILRFYPEGVTFPLGYTNGQGLYLPTSEMIPEGGYEVVSFWEYGFPAPLATGFEAILTKALEEIRRHGVE